MTAAGEARRPSTKLSAQQFGWVCASVLATVLAHASHLPALIFVPVVILLTGRWLQRARYPTIRVPGWTKLALVAILTALVIVQYHNVFGREPGSALVCAMLALKLIETETKRDGRAALSFASFVLMSALLFDTGLPLTLALFAVLALLLATLRALEVQTVDVSATVRRNIFFLGLQRGMFSLIAALPLAACAFIFFPRLDSPLWNTPNDAGSKTGISDSMAPGSFQNLLIDDSPAFRVGFDGALPQRAQLYWRGPVLTDFDGTTWTRHDVTFARSDALDVQQTGIDYEVTLEPTDKTWLFALDVPTDAPIDAWRGADMTVMRRRPVSELLRYRVHSTLRYRLDSQLTASQRRYALRLPVSFDPRSVALAQGWRRDRKSDDAVVHAALEFFHNSFFYTLSPPPTGRDSIDDFLFDTQRGFCEHYASAFVFLMRSAGIPARVVTGYQGGFFNNSGNYLLVRQSDAHAWAEVWLPDKGWTRVDPTAAVSPQRVELGALAAAGNTSAWYRSEWIMSVRNHLDLVNRGWNNLIVQFNSVRQQNLLASIGVEKADYATLTWMLIGTSSLVLCLIALWVMRAPRIEHDALDLAYTALCRKLERAGVTRDRTEGPIDYAARIASAPGATPEFVRQAHALLSEYAQLRYARNVAARKNIEIFARAVRKWRRRRVHPVSAS